MPINMKRCSMSLVIKEMHIKTAMRHHFTAVRMAIINKSTNSKCWRGCGEKGTLCAIGGNADWCSHCGKQYGISSQNKKWNCLLTQQFHCWDYTLRILILIFILNNSTMLRTESEEVDKNTKSIQEVVSSSISS